MSFRNERSPHYEAHCSTSAVVGDHVGRRVDCCQQRDGEQQLLHGFLRMPTSDTLNVLLAGRAGWVERDGASSREAACVVCRAWCVVRGRSLCRRAEEQLTVICVETARSLDDGFRRSGPFAQPQPIAYYSSSEVASGTARLARRTSVLGPRRVAARRPKVQVDERANKGNAW